MAPFSFSLYLAIHACAFVPSPAAEYRLEELMQIEASTRIGSPEHGQAVDLFNVCVADALSGQAAEARDASLSLGLVAGEMRVNTGRRFRSKHRDLKF
jgi:hypothetical protein